MLTYHPLGDSAIIIKFGAEISIQIHHKLRAFTIQLKENKVDGIIDLLPAYNELTVFYNPLKISYHSLTDCFREIGSNLKSNSTLLSDIVHIPVCYSGKYAPDIDLVAKINQLSKDELVKIHSLPEYLVYMLGFTPGFCYLGGMNEKIATPRKDSPRQLIEAGSVGIAGNQTGIYPIDSPGGWQIIGKTPLKLFDPQRKPEFLIEAANYIKFDSIDMNEFDLIKDQVEKGIYELKKEQRNG